MKKLMGIFLFICLTAMIFADGSTTTSNNKNVVVESTQSGYISIKTDVNRMVLSGETRDTLISVLKQHADCLNSFSTDQIVIKDEKHTGNMKINLSDKLGFFLYLNTENYPQYALRIFVKGYAGDEDLIFDSSKLNEFITLLDGTKAITSKYIEQDNKVRATISQISLSKY